MPSKWLLSSAASRSSNDCCKMSASIRRPTTTALCDGLLSSANLAIVERLLEDDRVDPSADDNYAVRLAAQNGHLAVVERLLQDERVDPSADNNDAVRMAARNGHLAVVDRLLEDDRVDVAVAIQSLASRTPQTTRVSRTLDRDLHCAARFGAAGVDHSPDSRRRSSVVDTAAAQQVELGVRGQALPR
jgi:hypothetical protein